LCANARGDGTILRAARFLPRKIFRFARDQHGNLGFLTEVELSEIDNAIEKAPGNGTYSIERRMMLQAEVKRRGRIN
jgi:NAD+ kinase